VRTVHDLIHDYQHVIADLTLVMGTKGVFDVEVDGETILSKHQAGRHADDGEVLKLFREHIGSDVPVFER
jgi:predicted Rdx family selenoprotein